MLSPQNQLAYRIKHFVVRGLSVLLIGGFVWAAQAKDQASEAVWIDVRSWVEYNLDHIEGDKHIHYTDIVEGVSSEIPDKNTPIRLYCAVGGRAGKAQSALVEAGYTDVKNMGGIDDARRVRGLAEE
jgi:phage shock protein E